MNKLASIGRQCSKNTFVVAILVIAFFVVGLQVFAARTDNLWQERLGSYIELTFPSGRDILINGANHYLNFGSQSGSNGYGFRDNSGNMEFKDSGGSWSDFGSGSGTGVSVFGDLGDVSTSSDQTGDVYYLNSNGKITNLNPGSNGEVLKISGGIPAWSVDNTGSGGGSGLWATSTDGAVYITSSPQTAVVGASATSTDATFEVAGTLNALNLSTLQGGFISQASSTVSGNFTSSGAITFEGLTSCDTIDTDGSGNLSCGTDDTGTDSADDLSDNTVSDLSDVADSGVAQSDILMYNGSTWIDQATSTEMLQDLVTLSGTPDYLTLSGQQITRNKLDLPDDINTFTETELENAVSNASNVFTNNDGALSDDDLSDNDTDDLSEGASNLYYTDARVNSVINASSTIADTSDALTWGELQTFSSGFLSQASSTVAGNFTSSDTITFESLTNCDTIDTDGNGVLSCGTDDTGSGSGSGTVSTSTTPTVGHIPYWTTSGQTPELLGSAATSSVTIGTALNYTGTFGDVIEGAAGTLSYNGAISDNSDVDTTGVAQSDMLMYDGTNWIAQATSTEQFQDLVTLSGTRDYLTISGQDITRGEIDVSDDTNLGGTSPISISGDNVTISQAGSATDGYLSSADWTKFNGKISTTSIDTESEFESALFNVVVPSENNDTDDDLSDNTVSDLSDVTDSTVGASDILMRNGANNTWVSQATSTEMLQSLVTLAGENYLSLSGQQITANAVDLSGSNVTNTLGVGNGGTGQTSFTAGNLLYGSGSSALQTVATSSPTIGTGLNYSGTFGDVVGGADGTLSLSAAISDLNNVDDTGVAQGNILYWNGTNYVDTATTTAGTGLTYNAGAFDVDLGTDIDISEIIASDKSGSDATLVTGTAGADGECAEWNADGDLVTSGGSCGGSGGSEITLDLDDDDSNESTDLSEIATINDIDSIFTEPSADKLLIDAGAKWSGGATSSFVTVCSSSWCDYQTDGTADDVQIQQALDTDGQVQLAGETYDIASSLVVDTNEAIYGVGMSTVLSLANSVDDNVIKSTGSGLTFFVKIKDLKIDGNRSNNTSGHAINMDKAHTWVVSGLHIDNAASDGIHIEGDASNIALNNTLMNNRVEDPQDDAIEVGAFSPNNHLRGNVVDSPNDGYAIHLRNTEIQVIDNHLHSCATHCMYLTGAADNNAINSNYVESEGTTFGTGGDGIHVTSAATGNRIVNNVLFNHDQSGIYIDGDENLVQGNEAFDRQGTPTQDYGLEITTNAEDTIVNSNFFFDNVSDELTDSGVNTTLWQNGTTTDNLIITTGTTTMQGGFEAGTGGFVWDKGATEARINSGTAVITGTGMGLNAGNNPVGILDVRRTDVQSHPISDATGRFVNETDSSDRDSTVVVGVAGSSSGDPFLAFDIDETQTWTMGTDNSDSDTFKLRNTFDFSGTPALSVDTSGNQNVQGQLTSSGLLSNASSTIGTLHLNNALDFSDYVNATAGTGISFTDDEISADLGTDIDTSEIVDGTLLPTDIDGTQGASSTVITTDGTNAAWQDMFFDMISGALDLATQVTGILGISNGGTGTNSITGGQPIASNSGGTALTASSTISKNFIEEREVSSTIYASSTLAVDGAYSPSGTTTLTIMNHPDAVTLDSLYCKVTKGSGSATMEVGNGTASSTINCTTTGTENTVDVSFSARQDYMVSFGNAATTKEDTLFTVTDEWIVQ